MLLEFALPKDRDEEWNNKREETKGSNPTAFNETMGVFWMQVWTLENRYRQKAFPATMLP